MASFGEDPSVDHDFDVLPVVGFRDEILAAVSAHQVVICIGETGSGKTTQIPQFLLDHGFCANGLVGVTQPRRIAAISVTERICEERNIKVGGEVGYSVRFEDVTSSSTKVKFMTDGILIRESLSDASLSRYSVIVLDEAHERSLNTDILFGLLKGAMKVRRDLKVIITSATLDTDKFGAYFDHCPIIRIPGRVFPVDIYHSKTKQVMTANGPANNSYVQSAVDVVLRIHRKDDDGHILVFLTGQDEIERMCALLRHAVDNDPLSDRELLILPLYAALPNDVQSRVFKKPTVLLPILFKGQAVSAEKKLLRKVVIATNIAETSITVPHVRFVVDAGYVKQKVFDPQRGMESLVVVPVSKIAALQRAGRAGRTASGQCYRLFSSECFDQMMDETVPEIQRTNLANTLLYLKALGIRDVLSFDFLDPPSQEQVLQALIVLYQLRAIDALGEITEIGRKMSSFPLDPHLSRMLLEAGTRECDCLEEMTVICAMLCVENVWVRPQTTAHKHTRQQGQGHGYGVKTAEEERCEIAHAGLRHSLGDFLTLHNVFRSWERAGWSNEWCFRNFVNSRSMKTAKKICEHLLADVHKHRIREQQGASQRHASTDPIEKRVCDAVTAGFYMNAAVRCANESVYKCAGLGTAPEEVRLVHISPQSAFNFCDPPEWVVYQELVHSTKLNMKMLSKVSRSCLKHHQKRYVSVPASQLSSGVVESRKRARDRGDASPQPETPERDATVVMSNEQAPSQVAQDAIQAAKLRYLSRKTTAAAPPTKKR